MSWDKMLKYAIYEIFKSLPDSERYSKKDTFAGLGYLPSAENLTISWERNIVKTPNEPKYTYRIKWEKIFDGDNDYMNLMLFGDRTGLWIDRSQLVNPNTANFHFKSIICELDANLSERVKFCSVCNEKGGNILVPQSITKVDNGYKLIWLVPLFIGDTSYSKKILETLFSLPEAKSEELYSGISSFSLIFKDAEEFGNVLDIIC